MLGTGTKLANFTLDTLDGGTVALTDLIGRRPVALVLFKVSCPVCQLTLPYLDRIARGSLQVVAISQDGERATRQFQRSLELNLPILLDLEEDDYPVSTMLGIEFVPSLFVVEPDGFLSMAAAGFVKADLETLGVRSGVEVFRADENVPAWKAG